MSTRPRQRSAQGAGDRQCPFTAGVYIKGITPVHMELNRSGLGGIENGFHQWLDVSLWEGIYFLAPWIKLDVCLTLSKELIMNLGGAVASVASPRGGGA